MKSIKKLVSVLLSALMVMTCFSAVSFSVSASTASDGTNVVYLKPSTNWKQDSARFAVYLWQGSTTAWVSMTDSDGDGYYEATIPSGSWTNLIFCRMNPAVTTNDWTAKWNQSDDLSIPDNMNCYTVNEGTWDNGGGTWSSHSVVTPTTVAPTTVAPTTVAPTTVAPTTVAPTTVAPTTVAPTTVAPTTVAPTTVAPTTEAQTEASDKLVVNATSNLFSTAEQTYDKNDNTITVLFKLKSSMKLINGQWTLSYDSTKLSLADSSVQSIMPLTSEGGLVNTDESNYIYGNFTNLALYDFSTESNFVCVTFNILATGRTNVNLCVDELGVAYESADGNTYEAYIADKGVVNDVTSKSGFESVTYTAAASIVDTVPTSAQATTQPTTQTVSTSAPVTQASSTTDTLKVNATSNLFPSATQTYDANDKTVTVTYKLTSTMKLFNGQWTLAYDNTKLSYSSSNTYSSVMPVTINGGVVNANLTNKIKGNFTSLGLYDFTSENDFIKVTFDVVGTGETTLDLNVEYLSVAYTDALSQVYEEYIADNSVIKDITSITGYETEKYSMQTLLNNPYEPTTAPVTEEPTTVQPTTAQPTTAEPTTVQPTTAQPTTAQPTTVEPTTVQPTTVEPTTVQPTTVEPTTEEPTTQPVDTLTVNASSNIATPVSETYSASDKTVTVTYKLTSSMKLVNGQWTLTYDSTKLSYSSTNTAASVMPVTYGGGIVNGTVSGKVKGNFTSLGLFDFTTENDFVKVVFDVIGTGSTDVSLGVEYLGVAYTDESSSVQEAYIVDNSVVKDVTTTPGFENEILSSRIVLNEPTPEYLYGDVNNDKIINVTDATLLQKHISMITVLDDESLKRADINQDGNININDVTEIQKVAAHG